MASDTTSAQPQATRVCPACGAAVPDDHQACAQCRARVVGPNADTLRALNDQITALHHEVQTKQQHLQDLHGQRATLVAQLQMPTVTPSGARVPDAPPPDPQTILIPGVAVPSAIGATTPSSVADGPSTMPSPGTGGAVPEKVVRPQAVLATAGVLALGAAAAVFAAVTWTRLPPFVQLGILCVVAGAAALGARALERRTLRVGAGGLAVLAVLVVGVIVGNVWDSGALTLTAMVAAGAVQIIGSRLLITRMWVTFAISFVPIVWLASRAWPRAWMDPASVSLSATLGILCTVAAAGLLRRVHVAGPGLAWLRHREPADWPAIDVVTVLTVAPWTLLGIGAGLSTLDVEPFPGLAVVLVAPYVLGARWLARRHTGVFGGFLVAASYALAAIAIVPSISRASVLSLVVANLTVVLVLGAIILGFESPRLRIPAVLSAGVWILLRPDLAAEPLVRAVRTMLLPSTARPTGLDLDTGAALATLVLVAAASLWAARGRKSWSGPVHIAGIGAGIVVVLTTPAVVSGFVLAGVMMAIAVTRVPVWHGMLIVLALSAGLLGGQGHGLGLAVLAVITIAALIGAWRTRRPEFDWLAGLLPPLYVLAAGDDLLGRLATSGTHVAQAWVGVAALVAVCVLIAVAVHIARPAMEVGVWLAAVLPVVALAFEGSWWPGTGFALLAVAAGVAAVTGGRNGMWWVARGAVTIASWIWLAAADITIVEVYAAVPAALLAGLGLLHLRRSERVGSWLALGPALAIAVIPSVLTLLIDPDHLGRVLGLLVFGVVVALLGWIGRLAAPLVMGAVTVILVAVVQFGANFDLVPRWISLSIAGALLLGAAITYDAQIARARQLGRALATLR